MKATCYLDSDDGGGGFMKMCTSIFELNSNNQVAMGKGWVKNLRIQE